MKIQPYLFFDGRCEEAIEFYGRAVGAQVPVLMRYSDSPEPPQPGRLPPGSAHKIMHAELHIGGAIVLVSDGGCSGAAHFQGFALAYTVPDAAAADRTFAALADGGTVTAPLTRTFFSPRFGMLTDRFGVGWIVLAAPE
jgi:PhnB protein